MKNPDTHLEPFRSRLDELRLELDKGQRHLELLDQRRVEVRDTVLRIGGAIQVLEELIKVSSIASNEGTATSASDELMSSSGHGSPIAV